MNTTKFAISSAHSIPLPVTVPITYTAEAPPAPLPDIDPQ